MKKVTLVFVLVMSSLCPYAFGTEGELSEPKTKSDYITIGEIAEDQKNWDKALSIYKEALKMDVKDPFIWLKIANIERRLNHIANAIEAYNQALALQPNNPEIHLGLAEIYEINNQLQEAMDSINKAVDIEPNNTTLRLRQGAIASAIHDWDKAEESYLYVLSIYPKHPLAQKELEKVKTEKANIVIEPMISEVDVLEKKQNWSGAITIYNEILDKYPSRAGIWLRLANAKNQLKHYENAIEAYKKAIKLEPNKASTFFDLAETYDINNQAKEALEAINQAIILDPNNIEYLKKRGMIASEINKAGVAQVDLELSRLMEQGNELEGKQEWNKAIDLYKSILVKYPNKPELWVNIANNENRLKHYAGAIVAYKKALVLEPTNASIFFGMSDTYDANSQPKEAWQAINSALGFEPNNTLFLIKRASLASQMDNLEQEKESYKRILKIDPNNNQALSSLEYMKLKAEREAKLAARSSLEMPIKPGTSVYYAKQAGELIAKKEIHEGRRAIQQAVCLDPYDIEALKVQAQTAYEEKDYCLVEKTYAWILELDPYNKEILLEMANLFSELNCLDKAARMYCIYLSRYPDSQKIWINYAKIQSYRGNLVSAFEILEEYRCLYGETKEYLSTKATILGYQGYSKKALCMLQSLLEETPLDYDLLSTKASLLSVNNEKCAAEDTLVFLEENFPKKQKETKDTSKYIRTPVRSNISFNPYTFYDSDKIRIEGIEFQGQYFLNPETKFVCGAEVEQLGAPLGSGHETIDNHSKIKYAEEWLGLAHNLFPELQIGGGVGYGEIERRKGFFLYQVKAVTSIYDGIQFSFQNGQNLYAAEIELENVSQNFSIAPKAVSLGIIQYYNKFNFSLQPFTRRYIEGTIEYDTFSDHNRLFLFTLSPHMSIFNSQYLDVDLGLSGNWYGFSKQLENGYYDPHSYQSYQLTSTVTIKQSENVNYIISMGGGTQKDETMLHPEFGGNVSLQAIIGIFDDWQLQLTASASANNAVSTPEIELRPYRLYNFAAVLKRRF